LVDQQAGDQETGDDEEDVDADESAREPRHAGVEGDDDRHRNGPQAIDVGPVSQVAHSSLTTISSGDVFRWPRVGKRPMAKNYRYLRFGPPRRSHASAASGIPSTTNPRVQVHYEEMTFFTHQVNGRTYGAWYRQLTPHEIEVMGAGFLRKATYAG